MAETKIELVPWVVPNFVSAKMPPRPRQEGWQEGSKWPLVEVDVDVLARMCDDFRAEVFRKAGSRDPARAMDKPGTADAVDPHVGN